MERETVNGLLAKLGVPADLIAGLTNERAEKKVRLRIEKNGVPAGLTTAEKELVESLGLSAPKVEKEEKAWYKLAGLEGKQPRFEKITPTLAADRNKRRSDERRWEPTTEEEANASAAEAQNGKGAPAEGREEKMSTKTKPEKTNSGKKKGHTAEKPPKEKRPPKKANSGGPSGREIFGKLFGPDSKPVEKDKVVEKLVAAGVKPATASSYVVWAKRPRNSFGFRVAEKKDEKGRKFLHYVGKAGKPEA